MGKSAHYSFLTSTQSGSQAKYQINMMTLLSIKTGTTKAKVGIFRREIFDSLPSFIVKHTWEETKALWGSEFISIVTVQFFQFIKSYFWNNKI